MDSRRHPRYQGLRMTRDPIPIQRGVLLLLPSLNIVEVLNDITDDEVNCSYRRHAGDNKAARVGVTLRRDFLERWGVAL
jgi:hypothetical protein